MGQVLLFLNLGVGFLGQLLDHLNSLELIRMVAREKELHVSFISRTDGTDRAFLLLDFFAVLVEIHDGVTVDDESSDLSIEMVDDDVTLTLMNSYLHLEILSVQRDYSLLSKLVVTLLLV